MKVLILASGRSRRMQPIKDKNFLKFAGKEVIGHQLDMLMNLGLTDIIVVGRDHNLKALQDFATLHGIQVVEQKDEKGMAGAVLAAEKEIGNEPVLIMGSNDIVAPAALEAMQEAMKSGADAYMLAYQVDSYFPGGYLKLEGKRITGIVEKPGEGKEPSDCINLVFHLYRQPETLFAALKSAESEKDDLYEVALDKLMKEQSFEAVKYDGFWQAIKYPWHVLDLMNAALKMTAPKIDPSAQIADTALIKGEVTIESGVKIFDHAVIQGPAYIGKNTVIANNALVRSSMIGANCVVGYSTEIARSFVENDCWFHSNYIGDSIIGDNVSFGSGAVCANLRLDEKNIGDSKRNKLGAILGSNIRIGVNTSIMPGVRIGSGSVIGSGLTLSEDITEGKFVYGKTELVIKENQAELDPKAREEMKDKLP